MLVGSYVGGSGSEADALNAGWAAMPDSRSRVDSELFKGTNGEAIRGMPGCKVQSSCNGDSVLGHFRLGSEGRTNYLAGQNIACSDGRAEC